MYQAYSNEALILNEGNLKAADYMLDCSVYEYFYRVRLKKNYIKLVNNKDNGN